MANNIKHWTETNLPRAFNKNTSSIHFTMGLDGAKRLLGYNEYIAKIIDKRDSTAKLWSKRPSSDLSTVIKQTNFSTIFFSLDLFFGILYESFHLLAKKYSGFEWIDQWDCCVFSTYTRCCHTRVISFIRKKKGGMFHSNFCHFSIFAARALGKTTYNASIIHWYPCYHKKRYMKIFLKWLLLFSSKASINFCQHQIFYVPVVVLLDESNICTKTI